MSISMSRCGSSSRLFSKIDSSSSSLVSQMNAMPSISPTIYPSRFISGAAIATLHKLKSQPQPYHQYYQRQQFSTNINSNSNRSSSNSSNSNRSNSRSSNSKVGRISNNDHTTKIYMVGGKEYEDVKQFRLLQIPSNSNSRQTPTTLASICVKRNIIFGPKLHLNSNSTGLVGGLGLGSGSGFVKILHPLLKHALKEASSEGDQPQGLAALNGLVDYVSFAMQSDVALNGVGGGVNGNPDTGTANATASADANGVSTTDIVVISPALEQLKMKAHKPSNSESQTKSRSESEAQIVLEAVYSIATQTPRMNHTTISAGTYNDARLGWTLLAKEYASFPFKHEYCSQRPLALPLQSEWQLPLQSKSQLQLQLPLQSQKVIVQEGDAQLFQTLGGILVQVEYIGIDENDGYWKDAGGAMGRFFFM